ncbi:MAG: carbohydrate kinase [Opitutaceae bacterium]|nr:carbohydrate kinase [Opitutaceae bacterium]
MSSVVLCFGEILWDFLPEGAFPGGAPFNVAYHLKQHGLDAHIASAVGRDVLGEELLRRLGGWGISTAAVVQRDGVLTGYVRAVLDAHGDAHYEIIRDVAWDIIPAEPSLATASRASALVFGSLAQRSAPNRTSLDSLLNALPASAHRVFDVNLRPPHDDLALVRRLAARATVLKLNADEAARLCGERAQPGSEEVHARALEKTTGCKVIVITAGAQGAGLWRADKWHWEAGRPIQVVDTVGAGDAFLAGLLARLLSGADEAAALAHACRTGEWVASCRGATPAYLGTTPQA